MLSVHVLSSKVIQKLIIMSTSSYVYLFDSHSVSHLCRQQIVALMQYGSMNHDRWQFSVPEFTSGSRLSNTTLIVTHITKHDKHPSKFMLRRQKSAPQSASQPIAPLILLVH